MATTITQAAVVSSSLASTGSFGNIRLVNSNQGGQIYNDAFGLTIDSDQGWYPLTTQTPYEIAARFLSKDGTAAIEIGDNSSTSGYNKIQVVGDSQMQFYTNNAEKLRLTDAGVIVNDASYASFDFRVEGNDETHTFFSDSGANKVTIGTSVVGDEKFKVAGNVGITGSLHVSGNITTSGSIIAKEFRTEFVNQIVAQASGSTTFGDSGDDTHEFTGSVHVSGALFVSGGNDSTPLINIHNSGSRDANIIEFDAWGSDQILGTKEWSEKTHGGVIMGQGYHANTGNSVFIRGGGNENGTVEHHFTTGTKGYMMTAMGAAGTTELQINYKGSISGSEIGTGSFGTLQVFDKGSDKEFWLGSSANVARMNYNGSVYTFLDADNSYGGISAESGSFYGDVGIKAAKKLYFDDGEPPVAGHTYIHESAGDVLDFVVGGQQMLRMYEGGTDYVHVDDNTRLGVGSAPDFTIHHDGSHTYVKNTTGDLYIQQHTDDKDIVFQCDDGSGDVTEYLRLDGSAGSINVSGQLKINTTHDGSMYFERDGGSDFSLEHDTSQIYFYNRTINEAVLQMKHAGPVVINEGGDDAVDFRVEGDTEPHLLWTDASTDRVGIGGTNAPDSLLHISESYLEAHIGSGSLMTVFETKGTSSNPDFKIVDKDNNSARAALQVQGNGGAIEALFVASNGNVGIGSTDPQQAIDIPAGRVVVGNNYGYVQRDAAGNSATIMNQDGSDILFVGDVNHTEQIKIRSANKTGNGYIHCQSDGNIGFNGNATFSSPMVVNYGVTINEGSNDSDTRIESNSQTHAIFVNAGEDSVGIFGPSTGASGSLVVGKGTNVPGGILLSNGRTFSPGDDISSHFHPVGHYSTNDECFSIDPTWSDSNLSKFFNEPMSNVYFTQSHDAPGGYAVYINGAVNVGGVYDSGFPYIPIKDGDVYYQEVWIKNVGGDQTHYMGSNEFNEGGTSLGGNPGSYGYWVMSNTNAGDGEWQKHSGYISGSHHTARGTFETGSMYWTPMALFNYGAGSGTRACLISGWKVIKVSHEGNHIYENLLTSGSISFGGATSTNVTGGLGVDPSGSAADPTHPWHGRSRIGSPDSLGISPAQGIGIKTPHGYVLHGPRNSSWNHIITDRSGNYFNTKVTVDGGIVESYDEALQLRRYQSNNNRITVDDGRQAFDMEGRTVLNMNASTTTGWAGISGSLNISGSVTSSGTAVGSYKEYSPYAQGLIIERSTSGNKSIQFKNTSLSWYAGVTSTKNFAITQYADIAASDADQFVLSGSGQAGAISMGTRTPTDNVRLTVQSNKTYQQSIQYDASTRCLIGVAGSGLVTMKSDNTAGYLWTIGTTTRFKASGSGDFHADGDVFAASTQVGSDIRLKENIKDTPYGLDEVLQLRPVEFDWKEKRGGRHDIGVIAQEIEEVIPEVVRNAENIKDNTSYKTVDYGKLSSVLIKAIQEQNKKIDKLQEDIKKLRGDD